MAGDTHEVQTEADELIKILESVTEISIPELSKKLKIPESVVEAIATFLEEEGLVSIQYKLTTPYVSLTEKSSSVVGSPLKLPVATANQVETFELSKDFSIADLERHVAWLSDAWTTLSEQELIEKTTLFLDQLTKIANVIITDQGPLNHSVIFRNDLVSALRVNEEVKKHLQMGESSVAQDLFGDLILRLRQLLKKAHALSLMMKYAPMLPENSTQVMARVRELIDQKRYDEAEALYILLKQKATEFPKTFFRKELQFDTDLSQLNQDLFSNAERHKSAQFGILSKQMIKIMEEIKTLISKKEISFADAKMRSLRLILAELPDIHPGQKTELESKVMRLQNQLLSLKGTYHSQAFVEKTANIKILVRQMDDAIQKTDVDRAADHYRDMKTQFQSLPDSYPDKKIVLQQEILKAFERLTDSYARINEARFQVMEKELLSTISEMAVQIKTHQYEKAATLYQKIKQIFYNLPSGHLQRKVELQQDILTVFDVFKRTYPQAMLNIFMKVQTQIKSELEKGRRILASGDIQMAWQNYYQILELFRRLPIIGPEQRREIRLHVLGFYRSLLQAADNNHLKNLDDRQNEVYERLLSVIMKFHDQIHERDFEQLAPTYSLLTQLFHELPLKIANADTRIRQEVSVLGREVQLYAQARELKEQRAKGENEKANLNAQTLRQNMVLVRTQSPTDEELFSYIDSITAILTTSFSRMPGFRGKAPDRLPGIDAAMKTLNDVAQQNDQKPKTGEVVQKIENLKALAYPLARTPT